ncbi:hypothetical protein DL95DRAFT_183781 [Leptodontidium sp. 2 PMI_412]|nr:hypothetical protein DL95DRAFT_183781 [Leptodontidium sp. 2 PMI_412]
MLVAHDPSHQPRQISLTAVVIPTHLTAALTHTYSHSSCLVSSTSIFRTTPHSARFQQPSPPPPPPPPSRPTASCPGTTSVTYLSLSDRYFLYHHRSFYGPRISAPLDWRSP